MMDETEIKKQREIGKQLFLIDIIHCEHELARKGGHSFLSRDSLAEWAAMSIDELDHFIEVCASLAPFNIAFEAAKRCREKDTFRAEKDAYSFILSTYDRMGELVAASLEIDKFEAFCNKISGINYQTYSEKYKEYPVDESYATPEVFKEAMCFYIKYLVTAIEEVISEGYDWDVITSMTWAKITEERYNGLVNAFAEKSDDGGGSS